MAKQKTQADGQIVAQNRKARHDYTIIEEWEAGICLQGTEVKSLRCGKATINESYIDEKEEELFLINAYIPEYQAGRDNHAPRRHRKLLLHKREIKKFIGSLRTKGLTAIPLKMYFNAHGKVKVTVALVKGKSKYDKREAIKQRDWKREKARVMREESKG